MGFALSLLRGRPFGALAAWAAFTLPSAIILVLFAYSAAALNHPVGVGLLHGLKVVAVAVVAQAVRGMARTLAPDHGRAGIAVMKAVPNGVAGATICLVAAFQPGFLLLIGALRFWDALPSRPATQAAMQGANAAVVGLLGAALYDPVRTSTILNSYDFALALTGFVLLTIWKAPPWIAVVLMASSAMGLNLLTTVTPSY